MLLEWTIRIMTKFRRLLSSKMLAKAQEELNQVYYFDALILLFRCRIFFQRFHNVDPSSTLFTVAHPAI